MSAYKFTNTVVRYSTNRTYNEAGTDKTGKYRHKAGDPIYMFMIYGPGDSPPSIASQATALRLVDKGGFKYLKNGLAGGGSGVSAGSTKKYRGVLSRVREMSLDDDPSVIRTSQVKTIGSESKLSKKKINDIIRDMDGVGLRDLAEARATKSGKKYKTIKLTGGEAAYYTKADLKKIISTMG